MADSHGDGSIAPRRSLSGPILPPPPPELVKAEEEKAQKAAQQVARKEAQKAAQAETSRAGSSRKDEAVLAAARRAEAQRQAEEETRKAEQEARTRAASRSKAAQKPPRSEGARPEQPRQAPRRTRRAQLRLVQVDAWSVMKTSFLLSIALGIVLVVAVGIIWAVLGAAGVWDSINSIIQQAVGTESGKPFDIEDYVGTSRVLGFTMLVAVLDVILITAIATLGAFLYNLSAALLGGVEVTLAEDD